MTLLPWQHSRSRNKSGNEKGTSNHTTHDWFSRSAAEPSRQAFTDLVKAHNRMKSDGSTESRSSSRPRTSTVNSSTSQSKIGRSRLSGDRTRSRSSSQCTHEDHLHSFAERPETSNKVLLGKGGILLQRTSSILSLSSATSAPGLTSPQRTSRASSAASRHDDLRCKISQPFDFQHITHTEDTQFTGLGRIDESTLADQFVAAITAQPENARADLRGIATSDLPAATSAEGLQPTSPSQPSRSADTLSAELPRTPPRPLPPPKDDKVIEHPSNDHGFESAGLMWLATNSDMAAADHAARNSTCPADLESKPLPELPVVHAITTEDDTAREMIASPLPSPPLPTHSMMNTMTLPPILPPSHRPSVILRSQNLYPTTKSSMPNLLAAHHSLTAPRQLSRHHSDMSLFQQVQAEPATASTRTSVSFAAVDIMNWEDAVDKAWDDVDSEISENASNTFLSDKPLIESASSTPLMMTNAACGSASKSPNRMSSSHNLEMRPLHSVKEDESANDLSGLGISSCPASGITAGVLRLTRSPSVNFSKRRSSAGGHVNESLTRCSSQESFILSYASSMGGTQRSSNSSVSATDLTSIYGGHTDDDKIHNSSASELVEGSEHEIGSARPESGCLPPDILEQISQFGATFSADQISQSEGVPPGLPVPQAHDPTVSRLLVPERRSSIVNTTIVAPTRKRSSTWGNRPRQPSTPSYSLFPSVHPMSSYTTVTSS